MTSIHATTPYDARRRSRWVRVLLLLTLALTACESGEAGDFCWSGWECSSGSCSGGTCDSGWVVLLDIALDAASSSQQRRPISEVPAPPPPSPSAPSTDYVSCIGLEERECLSRGCQSMSFCSPKPALYCSGGPDAGDPCGDCVGIGPCPSHCNETTYCY